MPSPTGRNNGPVGTTPADDFLKLYDALKVGDHVAIVSGLKDARLRH